MYNREDRLEVPMEYDYGLYPVPIEEKWTTHRRSKLYELLLNINRCPQVFISERLGLKNFDEEQASTVQRFEEKVILLKQMDGYNQDFVKLRMRLAEPQPGEFFVSTKQSEEIQNLMKEDSPIKMLGIIKEHNNPYINILTLFYKSAIMVWIYTKNLVLNSTVVHTKLVPTGGMALKDLLDVDNMNIITIVAEFLSGHRKMLTSREDIISETCLLSIKMSAN